MKKTPEQIASWAMEIQQLDAAHSATKQKLKAVFVCAEKLTDKLEAQDRELTRQRASFAAAVSGKGAA